MTDPLLKDKKQEPSKDDFEPFETDDKQDDHINKNKKSKFLKYLLAFIVIFLTVAAITYYICYKRFSISLNDPDTIMQKYSELGKKNDENLQLFPHLEFFLENADKKFNVAHLILHFNKEDVDKNRLLEAIKKTVRNQAILQSTFYKENGRYHIKFNPNLYPEIIFADIKDSDFDKYLYNMGYDMDFPINKLMYKFHIITTEKYLYCILLANHVIQDLNSNRAFVYTLNHTYLGDLDDIQLKKNDLYYASLYEYNLILKNETFIKDAQNYYYMNNYNLGRTCKNFHKDKDIQASLNDNVTFFCKCLIKTSEIKFLTILVVNYQKLIFLI